MVWDMKMCPICDRELGTTNYCPVCKKVIRNPWVISDGIYLNKSHSNIELNCDYHRDDRKKTYLNQRHDQEEKDCSYHMNSMMQAYVGKAKQLGIKSGLKGWKGLS